MSGFIATPPAPHSPTGALVVVDGWYPPIDINALRQRIRLRGEVTHERLVAAIEGGLLTVMADLSAWRAGHLAAGSASLAAVAPADQLAGVPRLCLLFERAVRYAAAAELVDLARDMTATSSAAQQFDNEVSTADEMKRLSLLAVRDMLGVTRTTVELI